MLLWNVFTEVAIFKRKQTPKPKAIVLRFMEIFIMLSLTFWSDLTFITVSVLTFSVTLLPLIASFPALETS